MRYINVRFTYLLTYLLTYFNSPTPNNSDSDVTVCRAQIHTLASSSEWADAPISEVSADVGVWRVDDLAK